LNVRLKFISVSFLLCLALVGTVFAAASTVQAYQQFEQDHQRITAGDVSTVSSWMTLPYIARIYHVPELCLYGALHISDTALQKHATLGFIADHYKKPANDLIHTVQQAILNFRKKRTCPAPPNSAGTAMQLLSMPKTQREVG
jgi:hypothetical protein